MRIIQLPTPIDAFTHALVKREIGIPDEWLTIDVLYGTVNGTGDFVPATSRASGTLTIHGYEYVDFIDQVKAALNRPKEHPDTDFWGSDVDAYLESDPVARKVRVDALVAAAKAEEE